MGEGQGGRKACKREVVAQAGEAGEACEAGEVICRKRKGEGRDGRKRGRAPGKGDRRGPADWTGLEAGTRAKSNEARGRRYEAAKEDDRERWQAGGGTKDMIT